MALSVQLFTISTPVPNVPQSFSYGTALVLVGVVLLVNTTSIIILMRLRNRRKW